MVEHNQSLVFISQGSESHLSCQDCIPLRRNHINCKSRGLKAEHHAYVDNFVDPDTSGADVHWQLVPPDLLLTGACWRFQIRSLSGVQLSLREIEQCYRRSGFSEPCELHVDEIQGEIADVLSFWLPLSKSAVSWITGVVQIVTVVRLAAVASK